MLQFLERDHLKHICYLLEMISINRACRPLDFYKLLISSFNLWLKLLISTCQFLMAAEVALVVIARQVVQQVRHTNFSSCFWKEIGVPLAIFLLHLEHLLQPSETRKCKTHSTNRKQEKVRNRFWLVQEQGEDLGARQVKIGRHLVSTPIILKIGRKLGKHLVWVAEELQRPIKNSRKNLTRFKSWASYVLSKAYSTIPQRSKSNLVRTVPLKATDYSIMGTTALLHDVNQRICNYKNTRQQVRLC
jgi:hypothetical protein